MIKTIRFKNGTEHPVLYSRRNKNIPLIFPFVYFCENLRFKKYETNRKTLYAIGLIYEYLDNQNISLDDELFERNINLIPNYITDFVASRISVNKNNSITEAENVYLISIKKYCLWIEKRILQNSKNLDYQAETTDKTYFKYSYKINSLFDSIKPQFNRVRQACL